MAWDRHGKTMLSDPVRESSENWDENQVFGADILAYLSTKYDAEKEFAYQDGTSQAEMVEDRVKSLFKEMENKQEFTLRLLRTFEYYLDNSMGGFAVGDKLTMADLAWFPYVYLQCIPAIDSGLFPNVQAWYFRMASISDVRKGAIGAGWGFEHKRFMDLLDRGLSRRENV
ncbi:hypothetical protein BJX66DRAFT_333991 [Aspergillus keveii]|uniref:GST C-terminal domain-containing protein n=1 Tax=Aspergillus keveii TaxID=714993 RepID=A0ABR4GJ70_9EURO